MTEIIKRENTSVATQSTGVGLGFERVDMSKVRMPRVKVMQGLSPELQDPDYNFKQGDIIHGLLMEKMPDTFIPIMFWDSKIFFVPRKDSDKKALLDMLKIEPTDNMFLCRSDDGKHASQSLIGKTACSGCKFSEFGWDGNPETRPLCTNSINVLALFEGQEMPIVIQFANTSHKYGRKFRDMAVFSGGAAFSKKYKLTSKLEQNEQGRFFTTPVKPAGKPTDEEFAFAMDIYKRFSGVTIEVEAEDEGATIEVEAEDEGATIEVNEF